MALRHKALTRIQKARKKGLLQEVVRSQSMKEMTKSPSLGAC